MERLPRGSSYLLSPLASTLAAATVAFGGRHLACLPTPLTRFMPTTAGVQPACRSRSVSTGRSHQAWKAPLLLEMPLLVATLCGSGSMIRLRRTASHSSLVSSTRARSRTTGMCIAGVETETARLETVRSRPPTPHAAIQATSARTCLR